ncbi:MAG: hypothetical protein M3041_06335 [Acidobacteriota bacterium]|nr:hypothetical protein [Acidobacteriota bacterium]
MRYLAVARFRLLSTIRESTGVFVFAMVPPLMAAAFETTPEPLFRAGADELLGEFARVALVAWLFHAFIIVAASEAFGSMRLFRVDATALPPDLMDSAPIGPLERFWGETLGIFAAMATIHVACLPLLAVVAVLSPLPTVVFAWIEAGLVALMILGSAGAAWKRLAPRTQWAATRTARSGILFLILFFLTLFATTHWPVFRDSVFAFILTPSMRAWATVAGAVENPRLLVILWLLLYGGYLLYYVNATRKPAEA